MEFTPQSIMKYFTADWYSGKLSEKKAFKARDAYWKYIDEIYERLPFPMKIFAKNVNLHDAVCQSISINRERSSVSLKFIGGERITGYFFLQLAYKNINRYAFHRLSVTKRIHPEVLSDEIELPQENLIAHKFLFVDKTEMEIVSSDIDLSLSSASMDEYLESSRNCKTNPLICDQEFSKEL